MTPAAKALAQISSEFEKTKILEGFLERLSNINDEVIKNLQTIALGGNTNIQNAGTQIKGLLTDHVTAAVAGISIWDTFREVDSLRKTLDSIDNQSTKVEFLGQLKTAASEFGNALGKYLGNREASRSADLVAKAVVLNKLRESAIEFFSMLCNQADMPADDKVGAASLEIYIPDIFDLADFIAKLQAIAQIYTEIAGLLGISLQDHPLRIQKIESGSLWALLFGDTKIVAIVVELIRDAAAYIHRNYTAEGKLASIPSKIETIEKALHVVSKLEALGIETNPIKEELTHATYQLGKSMNELLADQSLLELNGEAIPLGPQDTLKLGHRGLRRISYESPDHADPDSSTQ
ncbi:hypothetical protein ABIC63_000489 [Pseudacidovorax sp. 1753]|uniref:hypothetical protein n=1 Tax=Pseudacidovorax sp. 1753 TaxID=3156419 RepID=UPI003399F361